MLETEFIPAAKKSSRLMVVLHGLGDSVAGFRWLPDALGLPWMNYLLVNAPDSYYGGFSWYDFAGDQAAGVLRVIILTIARELSNDGLTVPGLELPLWNPMPTSPRSDA